MLVLQLMDMESAQGQANARETLFSNFVNALADKPAGTIDAKTGALPVWLFGSLLKHHESSFEAQGMSYTHGKDEKPEKHNSMVTTVSLGKFSTVVDSLMKSTL